MKSPGYAQAITWISEIWADLDSNLIARSFDQCGITSNNLADHHSQLRHFVRTSELIDDVFPIDQSLDEAANAFNEQHDDEWEADLEALLDDESDLEQSDEK